MQLTRRTFGALGVAALMTRVPPALAQEAEQPFVLPEDYLPTEVKLQTELAPYELHVDPNTYRMYWTQPKNTAIRYTVGIGRTGLYEPGEFYVGAKKEWPSWKPTEEMVERSPPLYARYAEEGMPGGPDNPLGAMMGGLMGGGAQQQQAHSAGMGLLGGLLDADGDGNAMDDVLGMLMNKRR